MPLAFILPTKTERAAIASVRAELDAMRPDQHARITHLLQSWADVYSLDVVRRAIKNTRQNLP